MLLKQRIILFAVFYVPRLHIRQGESLVCSHFHGHVLIVA